MIKNSNLISRFFNYTNERFPIPALIPYAALAIFGWYYFALRLGFQKEGTLTYPVLGSLIYLLLLFHLRIFDEHKDYEKDCRAHPERMLSKGEITLKELRWFMYGAIAIEAGIAVYLGANAFVFWVIAFFWSVLMLKEFFVGEWLNEHMTLYLITHQILIPLVALFAINMALPVTALSDQQILVLLLFLLSISLSNVTYEFARKTWSPDREHEDADSYTKIWGREKTVFLTLLCAGISSALMAYIYITFEISFIYSIIQGVFLLFLAGPELMFLKKPGKRLSKIVEISATSFLTNTYILMIIAFIWG